MDILIHWRIFLPAFIYLFAGMLLGDFLAATLHLPNADRLDIYKGGAGLMLNLFAVFIWRRETVKGKIDSNPETVRPRWFKFFHLQTSAQQRMVIYALSYAMGFIVPFVW